MNSIPVTMKQLRPVVGQAISFEHANARGQINGKVTEIVHPNPAFPWQSDDTMVVVTTAHGRFYVYAADPLLIEAPAVGSTFKIDANQGRRDAEVLAVLGSKVLIKYWMPAGACYLSECVWIGRPTNWRSISARSVPKYWREAVEQAGSELPRFTIAPSGRAHPYSD